MAKKPIDYRSFSPDGPGSLQEQSTIFKRWWLMSEGPEKASTIAGIVKYIQEHSSGLETQRQISARMYANSSIMGVNGVSYSKLQQFKGQQKDRVSYNVVQSVIDTVCAKIAKNKPRPLFLTSGAEWKLQRKAKKLDKFVEGVFYENSIYDLAREIFRDGCVYGTGVIYAFENNGRVKFERVIPSEIYVDEVDSFYGNPRQMHRVKNMDRQVLIELFPDKEKEIQDVSSALSDVVGSYQSVSDVITVAESWHLPSGPNAGDGEHVISVNGSVLLQEPYTKDCFPFIFLPWTKRMYGFWGQGLAEQVQNIQLEINKLLWVIQRSMHLAGSFKIAVENTSKIVKEHLNNDIGAILTYTNTPPQYLVPPIVPPEVYAHLKTLKDSAYEIAGVSQLSANSQKPAGLDSGKALREYNDIESDRFAIAGLQYEDMFLNLAKLTVSIARDIHKSGKKYKVKVPGKKFIDSIDWSEVDLPDDEFVLKLYPISSLPQDPEGRLQTIQEYAQAGFISPTTARRLLDFPDLEAVEELANAPEDRIHKILEQIVDDAEMTPPDEFMDLQLARQLALQYYNHGLNSNLEADKLRLILAFMEQITALEMAANPAPAAVPAVAPANPDQTPTSDLIPNVNQVPQQ